MTVPITSFPSPLLARMMSSASSHGTFRSRMVTVPFTSSATTMLSLLTSEMMRSKLWMSMSLNSKDTFLPVYCARAGAAWAA